MFAFTRSHSRPRTPSKGRVATFMLQFLGPPAVEGALQGWSPEAQEQYKRLRADQKRIERENRPAGEPGVR